MQLIESLKTEIAEKNKKYQNLQSEKTSLEDSILHDNKVEKQDSAKKL